MANWTCDGIGFIWLRADDQGVPVERDWEREPREVVRPLLGGGDANIAIVGYTPYSVSGAIAVANTTDAQALRAKNGTSVLVSDGTTTHTAFAKIKLLAWVHSGGYYVGTATFTRPRA